MTMECMYHSYTRHIQVFTDGSCPAYSTTSAFVISSMYDKRLFQLWHTSFSMAAEVLAIFTAIRYITRKPLRSSWVICSDSKAALGVMKCVQIRRSAPPLVSQIAAEVDIVNARGRKLCF